VSTDYAGTKAGISERFVPDQDRGRLIEVEHVARYRWAAQAAAGRTVLDAGCGTAYGSALLADAGAAEVVGVDIAESVLEAMTPRMPDAVSLETGDLRRLSYPDDRFDLIVCFEVIEHFEEPLVVLDELVRVLAPEGVLLISSPNRGVYPDGNPHHFHEFAPDELLEAVRSRLSNVRLVRQHDYIVSALLLDADYAQDSSQPLSDVELRKLVAREPGDELYTVAVASNGTLPELHQLAALTGPFELKEWIEASATQTEAITDKDCTISELQERLAERDRIAELLTDAEQRAAEIPDLRQRIADLERELVAERGAHQATRDHAEHLDARLMSSERVLRDVFGSPSWQVTKPLRYAKRRLKG
jgi:ubiquinone/menaquinone biosynthesis C-methylase UbiE